MARAEDVVERQPTRPKRLSDQAARVQARCPNLRPEDVLTMAETISYELKGRTVSGSDDEREETTGLNSGEVLATLMDLGMERHHSSIAGSQFPQVWRLMPRPKD